MSGLDLNDLKRLSDVFHEYADGTTPRDRRISAWLVDRVGGAPLRESTTRSRAVSGPTKRRKCLRCQRPFDSVGPGNRLCNPCRLIGE